MTKQQAAEIKKVIKPLGNFTVYFNGKKGELRYQVGGWYEGHGCTPTEEEKARRLEAEKQNILMILNALTEAGLRPKYHRDEKRYQGFINCRYIVFE